MDYQPTNTPTSGTNWLKGISIFLLFALVAMGALFGGYYLGLKAPEAEVSLSKTAPPVTFSSSAAGLDIAQLKGGKYTGQKQVPVLMYHYIREMPPDTDKLGQNLSVTPETFASQMSYLKDHGYEAISFTDLQADHQLPSKPIIITFDDGYADAYNNALPILKDKSFKAVFYLIVNKIGTDNYLTWDQVAEMVQAGMVMGSHSLDHKNLASTNISARELSRQLTVSKSTIETRIGSKVTDFCYPSGLANNAAANAVYEAGYLTAVSTQEGMITKGNYWLYLPRLRARESTNFNKILAN